MRPFPIMFIPRHRYTTHVIKVIITFTLKIEEKLYQHNIKPTCRSIYEQRNGLTKEINITF